MIRRADPLAITHRAWRPHYESRPYRQHPARREHIYGRVQPADPRIVRTGRRIPSTRIALCIAVFAIIVFVIQYPWPLLGHAASDAQLSRASAQPVPTVDAGRDH